MTNNKGKVFGLILLIMILAWIALRITPFYFAPFGIFSNISQTIKHTIGNGLSDLDSGDCLGVPGCGTEENEWPVVGIAGIDRQPDRVDHLPDHPYRIQDPGSGGKHPCLPRMSEAHSGRFCLLSRLRPCVEAPVSEV
jgi:hypothetical protein